MMKIWFKSLAFGTVLLTVGCASGNTYMYNDHYAQQGLPSDQFAYERDSYECDKENQRATYKTKPDGSLRGKYYYTDKSGAERCMRVRGWYAVTRK